VRGSSAGDAGWNPRQTSKGENPVDECVALF